MTGKDDAGNRLLVSNRKARHEYMVLDTLEAGLVLLGTEVKSIRENRVAIGDAYAAIENGEVWLHQMNISPFPQANLMNHEPLRKRKLLLHRREIERLRTKIQEKGLTLIPLSLTLVKNRVKIELGLCRGKKLFDKREVAAKRDADREMARARRER